MNILVANIGSTSFKYQLFQSDVPVLKGRVERIGQAGSDCPDYPSAIARCQAQLGPIQLNGIGFKAVHAGPVSGAQLIDDDVLIALEEFSFHAPAHNPPYIAAMRSFRSALPNVPLVALLETAFFDQLPEDAITYSVPYSWREQYGVRRYGFHGASHRATSDSAQAALLRSDLRHISCHLGGSSSMAAIRNGVAVNTSFGMSPQSGLPHNNRTGDLDPFAVLFVMNRTGMGVEEMAAKLATESGLAGISGTPGDVRDLEAGIAAGDSRCQLALDVLIRSIRHYLGAFLIELGGVDVLTFSGGIGENSARVRSAVCQGLEPFGIVLDPAANSAAQGEGRISGKSSATEILIVPADEERIVARATAKVIQEAGVAR